MYLEFYGFREKPFNLTPDPRFVFLSKTHREAFAHLLYGINNRAGFIALTGEVGSGKTTVLRALLNQLDADHYRTALIFNPGLSPAELLENVNREFGISSSAAGANLLDTLNPFLLRENAEGRTVVLVVDEAQRLESAVLEQIRLISNLETDREKLIQIVLAGQPELGEMLKRRELRQLSQRITVRYHLRPMDLEDTREYIHHRLEVAGGRGAATFSRMAIRRIYRFSRGLPRLVNAACDRALLAGYTKDTTKITYRLAGAAIRDVKKDGRFFIRRRAAFALALLVLLLGGAGFYLHGRTPINAVQAPRPVPVVVEKTPPKPEISREDVIGELSAAFAAVTESESARGAFNILAELWQAAPIPEKGLANFKEIEKAALDRRLRVYKFSGSLGALLRMDAPAILEFELPGAQGKRFICLKGKENEALLVEPAVGGRKSVLPRDLERHWSGHALIFWRDEMNLLTKLSPGAKGEPIRRLQGLLRETGTYKQPVTGIYDDHTVSAVKTFQSARGIEQDGIAGGRTLMLLYRSLNRFAAPGLKGEPS